MKKIFCAVLAIAAMASCSNEYTIDTQKQAIAFGEAFVNNGTRADYSDGTNKVEEFLVYGTVKGKYADNAPVVYIFDGATVKRPTGLANYAPATAWTCTETQYWVPNTNYAFTAVVDGELSADHSEIGFTVADGEDNLDLLYATATASVNNDGTPEILNPENTAGYVAFEFDHLLSKLQFNQPTHNMAGCDVVVTGIKVSGVVDNGVYAINSGTWAAAEGADDDVELTFSPVTGGFETRQILPLEQTLTVTISYDVKIGTDKISEVVKTGTIPAQTYAKGYVYAITPKITANKIEFTVEDVNGWETGAGITTPIQ